MWSDGEEKEGTYFGVPAQALLGEMSCWDDIPPKIDKHELESLGACYKGWKERNSTFIWMGVPREVNKKTITSFIWE